MLENIQIFYKCLSIEINFDVLWPRNIGLPHQAVVISQPFLELMIEVVLIVPREKQLNMEVSLFFVLNHHYRNSDIALFSRY